MGTGIALCRCTMFLCASYISRITLNELTEVKVEYILDGDSVIVSKNGYFFEIRLNDIDCPESDQEWGAEATLALINLIRGQNVYLEFRGECLRKRPVATIYILRDSKLINVNERMIMAGNGWVIDPHLTKLPAFRQKRLNELQAWAKRNKIGLWSKDNPIRPMIYRKLRGPIYAENSYYRLFARYIKRSG